MKWSRRFKPEDQRNVTRFPVLPTPRQIERPIQKPPIDFPCCALPNRSQPHDGSTSTNLSSIKMKEPCRGFATQHLCRPTFSLHSVSPLNRQGSNATESPAQETAQMSAPPDRRRAHHAGRDRPPAGPETRVLAPSLSGDGRAAATGCRTPVRGAAGRHA